MMLKRKGFFIVLLVMLLIFTLTSCIGIGDGALFDDIKTSETRGKRAVCTLELYGSNEHIKYDEAVFEGAEAEALLEYLLSAKEPYVEGVDDGYMGYNYMVASFEKYDKDGNKLPNYDMESGATSVFYIRDNDKVDQGNMTLGFGRAPLGYLEGAYEKLFGYIEKYGASKGYFCNISTEKCSACDVRASGDSVYECFTMLSEGNYQTGMDRTANEKTYVILSFWGAEDATYYVYSDDYVEEYTNASLFKQLGHLDGIYDNAIALFKQTLNHVTAEEYDAGVKLNCLSVLINNSVSRGYYVSDFEDVGCIYIDVLATDYYSYLVYFEACTREELDEKIVILEKIAGVEEVDKIYVYNYDTAEPQ